MDAIKSALLLNVLIPVKRFMIAQTWPLLVAALAFAGWRLGGARLAALAAAHPVHRAQWPVAKCDGDRLLCGVSVIVAIGHWHSARHHERPFARFWRILEPVIDTLQTLPSFVYLIPVVMLFRVGDFTAMIAIVLYALAPAVRYTAHGIRNVPPSHRGRHGCRLYARPAPDQDPHPPCHAHHSPRHQPDGDARAFHARHHRARRHARSRPRGVHGLDQGGYRAGPVAGLCVAAIAIIADRLIQTAARRLADKRGVRTGES